MDKNNFIPDLDPELAALIDIIVAEDESDDVSESDKKILSENAHVILESLTTFVEKDDVLQFIEYPSDYVRYGRMCAEVAAIVDADDIPVKIIIEHSFNTHTCTLYFSIYYPRMLGCEQVKAIEKQIQKHSSKYASVKFDPWDTARFRVWPDEDRSAFEYCLIIEVAYDEIEADSDELEVATDNSVLKIEEVCAWYRAAYPVVQTWMRNINACLRDHNYPQLKHYSAILDPIISLDDELLQEEVRIDIADISKSNQSSDPSMESTPHESWIVDEYPGAMFLAEHRDVSFPLDFTRSMIPNPMTQSTVQAFSTEVDRILEEASQRNQRFISAADRKQVMRCTKMLGELRLTIPDEANPLLRECYREARLQYEYKTTDEIPLEAIIYGDYRAWGFEFTLRASVSLDNEFKLVRNECEEDGKALPGTIKVCSSYDYINCCDKYVLLWILPVEKIKNQNSLYDVKEQAISFLNIYLKAMDDAFERCDSSLKEAVIRQPKVDEEDHDWISLAYTHTLDKVLSPEEVNQRIEKMNGAFEAASEPGLYRFILPKALSINFLHISVQQDETLCFEETGSLVARLGRNCTDSAKAGCTEDKYYADIRMDYCTDEILELIWMLPVMNLSALDLS